MQHLDGSEKNKWDSKKDGIKNGKGSGVILPLTYQQATRIEPSRVYLWAIKVLKIQLTWGGFRYSHILNVDFSFKNIYIHSIMDKGRQKLWNNYRN